ncbi:protein kinase [Mucilaginibacter sp.]|uniref:protein kinase domain-containing protein n=1 Tax=Mucilaginibacter sp. TaxID=1882438 RepID=UPI0025DB7CD0|nr:protein kinase [Mucilaginibacter sp.]
MSLKTIKLLNKNIPLPFRFTYDLPFSEEDMKDMPWLANEKRYYGVEEGGIKKGGRAIALVGFVSDEHDNPLTDGYALDLNGKKLPAPKKIVLKVPNLNPDEFTAGKINDYLRKQCEECRKEWKLTRARLNNCIYANPIFDFSKFPDDFNGELVELPVTVQFFLDDAVPLETYLTNIGQRTRPYLSQRGKTIDNWTGMSDPKTWIELAQCLAVGLADIHERRVAHGDIWPPNIFIKTDFAGKPYPVFIDFGDAFSTEPNRDSKIQIKDHAYRAPERNDGKIFITEQADVYSYGKLLLHLAIGEEPILSSEFRDYKRRQLIKEKFAKRNPGTFDENPFVIDIICKCVSLDPIDRPAMREILAALNSYVDQNSYVTSKIPKVLDRLKSLNETWDSINFEIGIKGEKVNPFLEELIAQRIYDVEKTIKGLSKDVVVLNDTRERLILVMISLFGRLGQGDSFISITSPAMWRSSALGMDGRYFSATELAAIRGASIQRVFIFSIQEVGYTWAMDLADRLNGLHETKHNQNAKDLANLLKTEINKYLALCNDKQNNIYDLPIAIQLDSRKQLIQIIKSHLDLKRGLCGELFDKSSNFDYKQCKGLFLGLKPVSTLSEYSVLKSEHPTSVFFFHEADPHDQYLLMITDCQGRNSYGNKAKNDFNDLSFHRYQPELKGLKVFKSVLGIPNDRIKEMVDGVFKQSNNVGAWIESFYEVLDPDYKNL